jgi:acyl-CoA reductase-like NAD-dependent aldehyde dehydrogenase
MPTEFRNEPFTDFSKEENAQAMRDAIAKVREQLGREYPLVIGGERIETGSKLDSINPANRTQVVGSFHKATKELASQAVEKAAEAFETWKHTPASERAELLFRVAAIMRERKHELSAWMIHEVAKTWAEADGDTAEAIDFCEFYGREMLRYAGKQPLVNVKGEDNELDYIPLGVGAVIPPWNFPLAIMAGMTVASVVTGNTVVLKPSSDAPAIAFKFFEILEEAGLPPGVVNFMTGSGAEVGDVVVDHPKTRYVAFTGSKEVGLRINERTAKIKMADPSDPSTNMSAVINEKAFKTINAYIEKGKSEGGRVLAGGGSDGEQGFFIEPTVIADVKPGDTIEQEEIFGPVLAVIKAQNYDNALQIANDTQFGLTGAVYSQDEAKLERARKEFHVGNLYLNRKCTGALVGVHPFGGFNMSGTDSKAGGRDYLLLFLQAKVSSERVGATTRRVAEATATD